MFDERLDFLRQPSSSSSKETLPIRAKFEHRASGATGEVEAIYWPAKNGTGQAPEQLVLYILGNPGLLNYYLPFLHHLHSLLPPTYAILSTSHIGHEPHLQAPPQPVELLGHLESKVELTSALRRSLDAWSSSGPNETGSRSSETERPRLVLMGHSVGGWMTVEVLKRVNADGKKVVHAGYVLFPSLGWLAESPNGRTMWPIFYSPVAYFLSTFSYFLRPILPLTSFPTTTLSLLRSPTTIYHCLVFGRSEMLGIREPDFDWYRKQADGNKALKGDQTSGLFGVWSANNLDRWVGQDGSLVQAILGGEEGGRVKLLKGVPHAFCLTQQHSEIVAETVASWMAPKEGINPPNDGADTQAPIVAESVPM